jgi:hypothetical protein
MTRAEICLFNVNQTHPLVLSFRAEAGNLKFSERRFLLLVETIRLAGVHFYSILWCIINEVNR